MTSLSRRRFLPLCAALIYSTLVHAQTAKPTPVLRVAADRPHAIYQQGETVTFEIKASPEAKLASDAEIAWTITKDGVPPTQSGKIKLTDGVGRVTAKLDETGFLLCRASVNVASKPVAALGGAGIDPTKIAPSLPVPADFEAFWNGQKEKLAAVAQKAQLTPVNPTPAKVVAFDVNFAAKTKAKGAFVTVGFVDTTCPPTSVYAAFNALPIADKKIFNDIPGGHSNSPAATTAMVESVAAHVKAQAAKR